MHSLTSPPNLSFLLQSKFGFPSFRPHQEKICQNVTDGKDVLVVMPTGAGKSLCYQLPGLARGGTTIVISPLLALIEDQVQKLITMGTVAERIHSGRTRGDSRQVCHDYLAGKLDFLFIAPERLSVPGFIEMLTKKPPSLITIDEAHCISQWGHDFRPDYRLLGDRIESLRPAPVLALTATATPLVQDDICKQLRLKDEIRSIHGFRRDNIAIHVVELPPSGRTQTIQTILREQERLPAIIYAPTRKFADQLFLDLQADFRVGIYHAGKEAGDREKNQRLFLAGQFDVIVATIAFGMGIDKSNIRTVIHAALPGSIEGYYQELGRAGRDGKSSQAILLHSYADQRTHDFFFERDYPEVTILNKIYRKLDNHQKQKVILKEELPSIDSDIFDKALEKLWTHRGAIIDFEENISVGIETWEKTYVQQKEYKQKQGFQMIQFAQASQCRMLLLVNYFGDQNDSGTPCGTCDFCLPSQAKNFRTQRPLSVQEQQWVAQIMAILSGCEYRAAGRIYQELLEATGKFDRKEFERLLQILARSRWITISQDTFQKDGQSVSYRKVSLNVIGKKATSKELAELQISEILSPSKPSRRRKTKKENLEIKASPYRMASSMGSNTNSSSGSNTASSTTTSRPTDPASFEILTQNLKSWRLAVAKRKRIPAFCVLSDRVLLSLCEALPPNEAALLSIKGIGPKLSQLYGKDILQIIQRYQGKSEY